MGSLPSTHAKWQLARPVLVNRIPSNIVEYSTESYGYVVTLGGLSGSAMAAIKYAPAIPAAFHAALNTGAPAFAFFSMYLAANRLLQIIDHCTNRYSGIPDAAHICVSTRSWQDTASELATFPEYARNSVRRLCYRSSFRRVSL